MKRETYFAPLEVKFADAETPGLFEGYGAVFGNLDSYGDVIQKGAFRDSLKDWGKSKRLPPMLAQHGGWGMTDTDGLPIGKWEAMSEDDTGLYVKGRLINLDTERGKQLYGAMKEGVLDGMSIGYRAKEFALGTKPEEPRRTLKKIDLVELSVVTFPANGAARVTSIKSAGDIATIREFEEALINGTLPALSAKEAKAMLAGGFKALRTERDAGGLSDELADAIRRNIKILS